MKLDRVFNFYSLFLINEIIIIAALTVENGIFFFRTGLIHGIAILFIGLAVSRVFFRYYTYDPILEKFIHASLFAMAVFAVSHVIEFVSMMVFKAYGDTVFANVANLYLIGILSMIIGSGHFVKHKYPVYTKVLKWFSFASIFILIALSLSFLLIYSHISLDPDGFLPYAYAVVLLLVGTLAIIEITKIKKLTDIAKGFGNYLTAAVALILLSALINIFYEVSLSFFGVAENVSIYIGHFVFYAALSLFFLSYQKFSYLEEIGVYKGIKNHIS